MSLFVRIFLLALIFELGGIYAVQASESFTEYHSNQHIGQANNQDTFITSLDLLNDFSPYEIIENTELTESSEEESDIQLHHLSARTAFEQGNYLHLAQTVFQDYSFLYSYPSVPFFVLFHTWKFHL